VRITGFSGPQNPAGFCGSFITKIKIFGTLEIRRFPLSKKLNMATSLKALENTFHISSTERVENRHHIATKLWNKYEKYKNPEALKTLIEYNRQDTINLYPLAEKLMGLISR